MLLFIQLKHIDFLEKHIEDISNETGTGMSRFPTANHLCSWAGLCPGNNESAGKKKSTKTREENKSLRGTLVECARACVHCKDTYFYAQYNRIAVRRGKNRAAVAVSHSMLIIIYNMISTKSH